MRRVSFLAIALALWVLCPSARADMADDFHALQQQLNSALLDVYGGELDPATVQHLTRAWQAVNADAGDGAAHALAVTNSSYGSLAEAAARIGGSRSLLQHLAALEMLRNQRAGQPARAQAWRVLITLPQFANADDGGILLQQSAGEARQPGVTEALAKEYIGWQVTRTRQLMDRFQRVMAQGDANEACVRANLAEIETLSRFPAPLLKAAGLPAMRKNIALPALAAPYDSPASIPRTTTAIGMSCTMPLRRQMRSIRQSCAVLMSAFFVACTRSRFAATSIVF